MMVISSLHVHASFTVPIHQAFMQKAEGGMEQGVLTGKHIYTTHGPMSDCISVRESTSSGPAGTWGWPLDTTSTVAAVCWTLVSSVCSVPLGIFQCVGRSQTNKQTNA